ncbi:hypothetical protein LCGC14_1349190 [marine sediment metagenome]|uniref:Uncharacterized protein n=1 Tax=marine sediment metagenome TaxID=412755 RepID=A0A0F9NDN8_9ZZZZ
MSEKKARLIVFTEAPAWIDVDAERKELRVGYTQKGSDHFIIEAYDIALEQSNSLTGEELSKILDIDLLLPSDYEDDDFGFSPGAVQPELPTQSDGGNKG